MQPGDTAVLSNHSPTLVSPSISEQNEAQKQTGTYRIYIEMSFWMTNVRFKVILPLLC